MGLSCRVTFSPLKRVSKRVARRRSGGTSPDEVHSLHFWDQPGTRLLLVAYQLRLPGVDFGKAGDCAVPYCGP